MLEVVLLHHHLILLQVTPQNLRDLVDLLLLMEVYLDHLKQEVDLKDFKDSYFQDWLVVLQQFILV